VHLWLVTVGEPLPTDAGTPRLLRTGMLAERLLARGHTVDWWNSTFDHVAKRHRADRDTTVEVRQGYRFLLLHGPGYRRNVSLRRWANHRVIAAHLARWMPSEAPPDLILCSVPNLELAREAVRYAVPRGIPVVLDLRDMWPDIFPDALPRGLRWAARALTTGLRKDLAYACRRATALTGITPEFIAWGLAAAGRPATAADRHFWLASSAAPPAGSLVAEAAAHWAEEGISAGSGEPIACFFGTMSRKLELDTVIAAAAELSRDPVPWRFVLCGSGDELARNQAIARDLPNVVFPGWVNGAQIWSLMSFASVGLAPYRSRADFVASVPTKAIEYLSAGLPVVSSLRGSLEALLARTEAGVTYPNGDSGALADVLRSLADGRRDRATLARRAREAFEREFVAERVYEEMAAYLETFGPTGG
jgi:glycosyltransferase involved in cell wall biosynthesis